MTKAVKQSLYAWALLALVFTCHRVLVHPALSGGEAMDFATFFVGWLSDVWVAWLFATLIFALGFLPRIFGASTSHSLAAMAVIGLNGIVAAMHQSYIDFFHFQIVPFHLTYVADLNFLSANAKSAANPPGMVVAIGAVFGYLVLAIRDPLRRFGAVKLTVIAIASLVLALVAHNRNIHWREQWLIPEQLRVNGWEHLYLSFKRDRFTKALSAEEWRFLESAMGRALEGATERERLRTLLTTPARVETPLLPPFEAIRERFRQATAERRRPLVLVVLMESQRPADSGPDAAGHSLTPTLDALRAGKAITFANAWASGTVTRGAQEAVFCGFPGGQTTSVMRGRSDIKPKCLPELLRERAETLWLHGGDGGFDGQEAFWSRQGITRLLTVADFPGTSRTGWGIGDLTFFGRAAQILEEARQSSTKDFLAGLLLTVTNHIPWDLPDDAQGLSLPDASRHPSDRTTAYADLALKRFIETLEARDLWQDTLLIVASDHGNAVPPRHPLYDGTRHPEARLKTHVHLIIAGGLVESAIASGQTFTHPVPQAGIATLIADLTDLTERPFLLAQNPFAKTRGPVLTDLGEEVYNPVTDRLYDNEVLTGKSTPETPEDRIAALHFRAFLRLLELWN